jgi:hypothetical protein
LHAPKSLFLEFQHYCNPFIAYCEVCVSQKAKKAEKAKPVTIMIGRKDDVIFCCVFAKKSKKIQNRIWEFPLTSFKRENEQLTLPIHFSNSEIEFYVTATQHSARTQLLVTLKRFMSDNQ